MSRVSGLILDLSFAGFVAVVDEGDKPLHQEWRPPGTRYDDAGDWVEKCLVQSGGNFSDLKWIAMGVGPGSFTGIRIAMAFAQGLAMPRNLPLYGFTTFAPLFLSCECDAGEHPIALIPANSGRFYMTKGLEHPGQMVEAEELLSLADPKTMLILSGNVPATDAILAKFGRVHVVEDKWNIPKLIQHARSSGLDPFKPYYLQLSAAEEKAGSGS